MLTKAIDSPKGSFVEIGVYKGGTAWWLDKIAQIQNRKLYLYDTFTGQPHAIELDKHQIGEFQDTDYETVKALFPEASTIKGIFPESAVEMGKIAFVHMDCDQYQSIKDSVLYLWPHLVEDGIIWFDDSPCLEGAKKAVAELFHMEHIQTEANKHFVVKSHRVKLNAV